MKLTADERAKLRQMFGGKCAYCGCDLPESGWHADHVEPVKRDGKFVACADGFARWRATGELLRPQNDHKENLFPACHRCNILKADTNVEGFRKMLSHFAESIPTIRTYSHVHHLMRFKRLTIDTTPVVFWFETYRAQQEAPC